MAHSGSWFALSLFPETRPGWEGRGKAWPIQALKLLLFEKTEDGGAGWVEMGSNPIEMTIAIGG